VGGYTVEGFATQVAMTDAGTFAVTGGNLVIGNGGTSTFTGGNALDLSGLSNFVYSVSAGLVNFAASNRCGGTFT